MLPVFCWTSKNATRSLTFWDFKYVWTALFIRKKHLRNGYDRSQSKQLLKFSNGFYNFVTYALFTILFGLHRISSLSDVLVTDRLILNSEC